MTHDCFSVLSVVLAVCTSPVKALQPNIILIMADQMRADGMGCAGNTHAKTPNLDRLAANGARYKYSFSSTPTCTPARAAILTGLSPWYHGMLGYGAISSHYDYELPRALADGGYYTCSVGKDHFGWNKTSNAGIAHGYDITQLYDGLPNEDDDYDKWFAQNDPGVDPMSTGLLYNDYRGAVYALPEYYHPTAWVGRTATNFLENYNFSKPLFLKISFHRPHSPYDPPKRWMEEFDPTTLPKAWTGGSWDSRYNIHFNKTPDPGIWCGNIGDSQVGKSRQAYYGSIGFVDEWIGNIFNILEKRMVQNNTFILFTADHGDMMGDHYHWRKGYPYYGSASIPMLLSWPPYMEAVNGGKVTVTRGSVLDSVVELRDIFPTFLDVAGLSIPQGKKLNGSSLISTLNITDKQSAWRQFIDLEHDICYNATNHWNALTNGHIKYIYQAYFGDEQLFNLDSDPEEKNNLATNEEWKDVLLEWRGRMIKQFEIEGRGSEWVQDGQLMKRVKGMLYSPNYPNK